MNEPTDPYHTRLIDWYHRCYTVSFPVSMTQLNTHNHAMQAVRAIDSDHIIYFDGNTFASDFSHFGDSYKSWSNSAYSIHDYTPFGFPSSPEAYIGTEVQQHRLRRSYEKKRAWMDEHGLCVWNGEWGPVYARRQYDGDKTDEINEQRYHVLKDQLEIYNKVSSVSTS
jgi:hypothetical protein